MRAHNMGPQVATYSVVARDAATGDLGVAVASRFLAVGAYVPTAVGGVGAVATQAHANTTFGSRAVALMAAGASPDECAAVLRREDPGIEERQFGIVDASGASVSFTGSECHAWAGGVAGENFAAQGNILTGEAVVDGLVAALGDHEWPFPERLLRAMEAAEAAGGDRRGRQSAALLIVGEGKGYAGLTDRWIDLRVDDHEAPVTELARLLKLHRLYLDAPSGEVRELSADDISFLQGVLGEEGYLKGSPSGAWDDATERALKNLFGVENLEMRWREGPVMDPVAFDHLRSKFA